MDKVIRTLVGKFDTVTVELDTVSISVNGEERFRLDNDMLMCKFDGRNVYCGMECCEVNGGDNAAQVYIYTHGQAVSPMGVVEPGYVTYKLELDDTHKEVILTMLTRLNAITRRYRYN